MWLTQLWVCDADFNTVHSNAAVLNCSRAESSKNQSSDKQSASRACDRLFFTTSMWDEMIYFRSASYYRQFYHFAESERNLCIDPYPYNTISSNSGAPDLAAITGGFESGQIQNHLNGSGHPDPDWDLYLNVSIYSIISEDSLLSTTQQITRLYQTGKEVLSYTCQLSVLGETVFLVWKHHRREASEATANNWRKTYVSSSHLKRLM